MQYYVTYTVNGKPYKQGPYSESEIETEIRDIRSFEDVENVQCETKND